MVYVIYKTQYLKAQYLIWVPMCHLNRVISVSPYKLLLYLFFQYNMELWGKAYCYNAPHIWNKLQQDMNLHSLHKLNSFKDSHVEWWKKKKNQWIAVPALNGFFWGGGLICFYILVLFWPDNSIITYNVLTFCNLEYYSKLNFFVK